MAAGSRQQSHWVSLVGSYGYGLLDKGVGEEAAVGQGTPRHRRSAAKLQPVLNSLPLVCVPISSNHRVNHLNLDQVNRLLLHPCENIAGHNMQSAMALTCQRAVSCVQGQNKLQVFCLRFSAQVKLL